MADFRNKNELAAYLAEKYVVSRRTVYNHCGPGKLTPVRGGGFSRATVDRYAGTVWTPRLSPDQDPEAETAPRPDQSGAQERRIEADAELKRVNAELQRIKLDAERGRFVLREDMHRELAVRAGYFRSVMEPWGNEVCEDLAAVLGANELLAREMLELGGGDPDRAPDLVAFIRARVPDVVEMYRERLGEALNAWANGEWFTPEVREVMEGEG